MHHLVPAGMPRTVAWLGYGGLLPFVACVLGAWTFPAFAAVWHLALVAYGALILSFVGALHWAFAMQAAPSRPRAATRLYVWSVVPVLLAFPALMLAVGPAPGQAFAALLLVAAFGIHLLQDHRLAAAHVDLPPWYLGMRRRLTAVAVACLLTPPLYHLSG